MKKFIFCPYCISELKEEKIDGKIRKYCKKCNWINYINPVPAVACVVKDYKKRVLMIKRDVAPEIGKWAIPSGFMETDEGPEEAALRELKEETGIKGEIVRLLGTYYQKSRRYGAVLSIGYLIKKTGGELKAGDDARDAKYLKITDISKVPFESHRKILKAAGI